MALPARGLAVVGLAVGVGFWVCPAQASLFARRGATLTAVDAYAAPTSVQLVLTFSTKGELKVTDTIQENPPRVVLEVQQASRDDDVPEQPRLTASGLKSVRIQRAPRQSRNLQIVVELPGNARPAYKVQNIFHGKSAGRASVFVNIQRPVTSAASPSPAARRTGSEKDREAKVVVIDPGHGGPFTGACHNGLVEKDVALDVSLRFARLVDEAPNMRPVLTRTGDYAPVAGSLREDLEERRKIAIRHRGDIFISIHLNSSGSSHRWQPRGWEVFYLSKDRADLSMNALVSANPDEIADLVLLDQTALESKARLRQTLSQSSDIHIQQSRHLASIIAQEFQTIKAIPPRPKPIRPAHFDVLTTTSFSMPTVLVELAFLTNPTDADLMKRAYYRDLFAVCLFNAVNRYFAGEKGFRPVIAAAPQPTAPVVTLVPSSYRVKRGDTLEKIASQFQVAIDDLRRENHIRKDVIIEGQILRVPRKASPATAATAAARAPATSVAFSGTHEVRKGDTLGGIAAQYGTTIDLLQRENRLSGTTVVIGQKLKVPAGKPQAPSETRSELPEYTVVSYTVRNGDTLSDICLAHGCTLDELRQVAGLKNDRITAGSTLNVPSRKPGGTTATRAQTVEQPQEESVVLHNVAAGDTLSGLALRYRTSAERIRRLNGLSNSVLIAGTQLRIPAEQAMVAAAPVEKKTTVHLVQRGDSLSRIAARYGTSVEAIRKANGLESMTVRPAQRLVIPDN